MVEHERPGETIEQKTRVDKGKHPLSAQVPEITRCQERRVRVLPGTTGANLVIPSKSNGRILGVVFR